MSDLAAALVAAENEANFTDFVQGFTSGYGGGNATRMPRLRTP
ncbi:hypothetical protein ABZV58_05145 [Nocardia sp. NPDC004654]